MQAVRESGKQILQLQTWKIPKKVQKTLEKGLDKGEVMWYNNEVAAQKGRRNDPWKLNNKREVQSIEVCANGSRKFFEWEYYSNKSKEAKSKTRKQIESSQGMF